MMTENAQAPLTRLLALPMAERMVAIESLSKEALHALATVLQEQYPDKEAMILKNRHSLWGLRAVLSGILASFPEVKSDKLAIDRRFPTQQDKLDAIIEDINRGNVPPHRLPELIHENLYEQETFFREDGSAFTVTRADTFLTYALPKIHKLEDFLKNFSRTLGDQEFAQYAQTPCAWTDVHQDPPAVWSMDARSLYLLGRGPHDRFNALSHDQRAILQPFLPDPESERSKKQERRLDIAQVNTHIYSSHQSADESHINAFKRLIARRPDLGIEATFAHAPGSPRPAVTIKPNKKLDAFVKQKNREFFDQLSEMVCMDNATLFDRILRHGEIDRISKQSYRELSADGKKAMDAKLIGMRFMANAAHRLMAEMIVDPLPRGTHASGMANCGLTMEQIMAILVDASQDTEAFIAQVHPAVVRMMMVRQLHDMIRGYNTDAGEDKPEENIFPEVPGPDRRRCFGGWVNSAAGALSGVHPDYVVKVIREAEIIHELRQICEGLVRTHQDDIRKLLSPMEASKWKATNQILGKARAFLQGIFDQTHREQTAEMFRGYVPDRMLEGLIDSALDRVPFPEAWLAEVPGIERLSIMDIDVAIQNHMLPLLSFDKQRGYEPTLGVLASMPRNEILWRWLADQSLASSDTARQARTVLSFLSRSQLPEAIARKAVVTVKGKPIDIASIQGLTAREIEILCTMPEETLLAESLYHYGLFVLYVEKIGLSEEELGQRHGDHQTHPLEAAIWSGSSHCLRLLLDSLTQEEADEIFSSTRYQGGKTLFAYAVTHGTPDSLRVVLDKLTQDQVLNLLSRKNRERETPFCGAISCGSVQNLRILLDRLPQDRVFEFCAQKDERKRNLVYFAISEEKADCLRLILDKVTPAEAFELIAANAESFSAFYNASIGPSKVCFQVILDHITPDQAYDLMLATHHDKSPLHWILDRAIYLKDLERLRWIVDKLGDRAMPLFIMHAGDLENTPLHTILSCQNADTFGLILDALGDRAFQLLAFKDHKGRSIVLDHLQKNPAFYHIFERRVAAMIEQDAPQSDTPSPTPQLIFQGALSHLERYGSTDSMTGRASRYLSRAASVLPDLSGQEDAQAVENAVAYQKALDTVLKKIGPAYRKK